MNNQNLTRARTLITAVIDDLRDLQGRAPNKNDEIDLHAAAARLERARNYIIEAERAKANNTDEE